MAEQRISNLHDEALRYHREGRPGKIEIGITKSCADQRDLSLAYTPGVAEPCREIVRDPHTAFDYTAKGNLVAVVTNGTAVLGLGDIGPLAGKPVMEGKALLFKRFADVDAFDLEIDEKDPARLIEIVASMEPTFGGINLEDIKAPECFEIEEALIRRMKIPVFHDDQHGTAIITAAALLNALEVVGKRAHEVKIVFSGAGAGAVACAQMVELLGVPREHIWMCDREGVITADRAGREPHRGRYAKDLPPMPLAEALLDADVLIGLSVAGLVTAEMVRMMAPRPIVFAMANPDPEIMPEAVRLASPDAIIATGRSDYPNQVNNVLGFPFIFRGALDVAATRINEDMKLAAAFALASLAKEPVPKEVCRAYDVKHLEFGPGYLIPKPLDPRVLTWEAPAVAEAAMKSGVARRPIADIEAYRASLAKRMKIEV
jgi:malate dehydrogenase (oxaloacetate-decarboxylating)(NADP+)